MILFSHFRTKELAKPFFELEALDLAILALALWLTVFGVKALLVAMNGSPIPYWDQWDAEAANLYLPYASHKLSFWSLLSSHNEHRILFPRLLGLLLLEIVGEWDPVLQMLVNAALHACAIVALVAIGIRVLPDDQKVSAVIFSALVFSLPVGWENIFSGFQSCFYFVLLFSILSIAGFCTASPFSLKWLGSLALSFAAYLSMASGALSFFAGALLVLLQIAVGSRRGLKEWAGVCAIFLACAVCFIFIVKIPAHAPLQAHGFLEFVLPFLKLSGFPLSMAVPGFVFQAVSVWTFVIFCAAILLHAPLLLFAWSKLLARAPIQDAGWPLIGFAIWVATQMISLAYGRATSVTDSRYLDLVIIMAPVNYVALSAIYSAPGLRQESARTIRGIRSVWSVIILFGLLWVTLKFSFVGIAERRQTAEAQRQNVQAFLATGDQAALNDKPFLHIPYPDAGRLASLLTTPLIREFLPSAIRPADADVQHFKKETFLCGVLSVPTAHLKLWLLKNAAFITGFGAILLFICLQRRRPCDVEHGTGNVR